MEAPVNELGTIYTHGAEFRAHIHFRDSDGKQNNIYDQVVVLKMKLKKIWIKFVQLGVSDQFGRRVSK